MLVSVCCVPAPVAGTVTVPPSKSDAHRALIAAALAVRGDASARAAVSGLTEWSQDLLATRRTLAALGVSVHVEGETAVLTAAAPADGPVDCGESGTTLRLLLPVFAACGVPAEWHGQGRLPQRPLGVYEQCLPAHGVTWRRTGADQLPLHTGGRLTGGAFAIPGDVSSQFVSGLLLALPLCGQDSTLCLATAEQSAGYADMTLQTLHRAGIDARRTETGFAVRAGRYLPGEYTVEGDWSQAAFPLAAGALSGTVTVTGLRADSRQRDARIVPLLRRFGAAVTQAGDRVTADMAPLTGCDIDAGDIPDLVPVLAVLAAAAAGTSHITHVARLRLKESDRLAVTADNVRRLGAAATVEDDALIITGVPRFRPATLDGAGDHRIVMSAAVAALHADGPITVTGQGSVAKSWPSYFTMYQQIGGICHVVDDR